MKKIIILNLFLLIVNHSLAQVFTPGVTIPKAEPVKTQEIPGFGEYGEDNVDPSLLKDMKITTYTSEPCTLSGNEKPFDS